MQNKSFESKKSIGNVIGSCIIKIENYLNKNLIYPQWYIAISYFPFIFLSCALIQVFRYNKYRQSIYNILADFSYKDIFITRDLVALSIGLAFILYFPFLLTMIFYFKSRDTIIKIRLINEILKLLVSYFITYLIKSYIKTQLELLNAFFVFAIIYTTISIFSYLIKKNKIMTGSYVGITRVFLGFIFSLITISIIDILLFVKLRLYILNTLIYEGLSKDVLIISVIYILLVTFSIWIASTFSITKVKKGKKVKHESSGVYLVTLILIVLFIIVGFQLTKMVILWSESGDFKTHANLIYNKNLLELNKDESLKNINYPVSEQYVLTKAEKLQKDHAYYCIVYCLFIGTVIFACFLSIIKICLFYSYRKYFLE